MQPVRFGILGCARICRRGMIPGIQRSGVATLQAIASRQGDTAREWAAEYKIPAAHGSYEALIADPNVEAVYIPLPNELHLEWTAKAAAAGKHVLCEKPLALDVEQAEEMVAVCRRHGVVLMEAFMWRHHPRVLHTLQMLRGGELGTLRMVKMDFSFKMGDWDWRLEPHRGGGALFDLGCYGINAARLFTGAEPTALHAVGHLGPTGVDLTVGFQLLFPGDVVALLDCSFECPYRNRLEVVGTDGAVEFPEGVLPPVESKLVVRRGDSVEELQLPAADQYAEQVKAFVRGIREGILPAPAEDGLANMQVLQAVKDLAWR